MALADRHGLSALTVRKLAAEVGAPPMSLYTHFASKEQLLDLMFDRLVQRLFQSHGGKTWQQEFETAGRHARSVLLAHPSWIPLLTRAVVPTSSLGFYDHMLRLMADDGFPRAAAVHAFSSAMSFAIGSVLTERMMTTLEGHAVTQLRLALLKDSIAHLEPGTYRQIALSHAAFDAWTFERVFDLGLRSLILGIESTFARSAPTAKKKRAAR